VLDSRRYLDSLRGSLEAPETSVTGLSTYIREFCGSEIGHDYRHPRRRAVLFSQTRSSRRANVDVAVCGAGCKIPQPANEERREVRATEQVPSARAASKAEPERRKFDGTPGAEKKEIES
jgi:hypothetical protein